MDALIGVGIVIVGFVALLYYLNKLSGEHEALKERYTALRDNHLLLQNSLQATEVVLGQEQEKNRSILSQKKSSETRLGQITEHLVGFLNGCPYDPKAMHFLGNPIDFVIFDFDQGEITFLEVKSGNSKPTKRQKIVKHIVKQGRINYAEIRINEKGVKHKKILDFSNEAFVMTGDKDED